MMWASLNLIEVGRIPDSSTRSSVQTASSKKGLDPPKRIFHSASTGLWPVWEFPEQILADASLPDAFMECESS